MLTKIIDLGHEVPNTGEPRVSVINNKLVKTASTEIQTYWDAIEKDDTSSYLWVIGVSAMEFYGCNNNGDAFTEEDLKKSHSNFVSTAHVFLQHVNKDPNKSIGRPVFSWYNDAMHRVELILKIDKKNPAAQATVEKIKRGEPIYVSMGCFIDGTQITLSNGLIKNIEDTLPDDEVITHTGSSKKVTSVMRYEYTGYIYKFEIEGLAKKLICTEEHPIFIVSKDNWSGWMPANRIVDSDSVVRINSDRVFTYSKIKSIEKKYADRIWVNNLSVADDESYLANSVIVHNCTVAFDQCSICGNQAKVRKEYCDHLRYNMKKILPDGRQVYALNPNPRFFDISIVAKPADPTAHTLDKMASYNNNNFISSINSNLTNSVNNNNIKTAAELGEISDNLALKVASLKKVSDIVKQVDGHVVDTKTPIQQIQDQGFEHIDYPELPYEKLTDYGVSPFGLLSCLSSLNAPVTLGDAAWMCGSSMLGRCPTCGEFRDMFSMFPSAVNRLTDKPELIDGLVNKIFGCYNGEFDEPARRTLTIRIIKPIARARITIIKKISDPSELEKIGAALGQPLDTYDQFGHTLPQQILNDFRSRRENFAQIELTDKYGNRAVTTPYHMRQTIFAGDQGPHLFSKPTVAAALALGAIGAIVSQPTLLRKALALASVGLPASAIISVMKDDDNEGGIVTSEGDAINDTFARGMYKQEKTAAIGTGTLAGLAVPGALALDYAYNKWRYGPYAGQNVLDRAGEFVTDHPVLSGAAGALLGHSVSRIPGLMRLNRIRSKGGRVGSK